MIMAIGRAGHHDEGLASDVPSHEHPADDGAPVVAQRPLVEPLPAVDEPEDLQVTVP